MQFYSVPDDPSIKNGFTWFNGLTLYPLKAY